MNKKLFALLTSAAMMAACAPSVFADDAAAAKEATLKFVADKTTVAPGEDVNFDVYVTGDVMITTLQFTLDATGGEIATDIQTDAKTGNKVDNAFKWDEDSSDLLQWGKKNRGYIGGTLADMTAEQLAPFNGAAKDYMVLGYDVDQAGANPAKEGTDGQIKIGTIAVKAGESGEVKLDSTTLKMANYLSGNPGDENREVMNANVTTEPAVVTISGTAATSSEEESKAESSAVESKAAESSAAESKAPASSTKAADSSSKAATTNNNSTTTKSTSSTAKTNNTNDNKNTGAASTAAVALVGAAAALVVVSKKRK
ncbi:MAG: hypothetical protein IK999_00320 [Ruminococcus sp.]|nr:hypothetical protein [Ruminococcus sp.]